LRLTYNWGKQSAFPPVGGRMFGKIGIPELLIIMAIALLIFGPGKLAELGKGMGEGIKGFKAALKDDEKQPEKKE
jgi:sec-independent protein translocase protein TatA